MTPQEKVKIAQIIQEFRTLFSHEDEDREETEQMREDNLSHWLEMTLVDLLAK